MGIRVMAPMVGGTTAGDGSDAIGRVKSALEGQGAVARPGATPANYTTSGLLGGLRSAFGLGGRSSVAGLASGMLGKKKAAASTPAAMTPGAAASTPATPADGKVLKLRTPFSSAPDGRVY